MTAWHDDHPDLRDIGNALQRRLDRILEAEQAAAAILARRTTAFRDRLLDIEGERQQIVVSTRTAGRMEGALLAVCADHVELEVAGGTALILLDDIVTVQLP